ncbi:DNA-binding protein [Commensalibacter sp. ESL0390]|nr:DNA-binding protein [Commensalibacter melissae]
MFITTKSETKDAINVTIEIIKKFEAYERGEITSFQIPQSYSEALCLAADQAEQIKELKPKADGFDRIATADGSLCITDAAKTLQMGPKELFFYLNSHEWIYRRTGNKNWLAYQDKIKQGLLEHKVTEVSLSDGTGRISEQVRITPKGLTRLSEMFSNHV